MISSRSFFCPHYKEQPPEPLPRPCWLNHTTQHSLSLNNLNCLSIANLVSCLHRLLSKTSPILSPSRLFMVSFMSSSSLPVSVSLLLSPHCLPPSLFFSFLSSSSSSSSSLPLTSLLLFLLPFQVPEGAEHGDSGPRSQGYHRGAGVPARLHFWRGEMRGETRAPPSAHRDDWI